MAQLIRGTLQLRRHQETLLFMDCFGNQKMVVMSLLAGPSREDKIASTLSTMTDTENAVKAYAEANSIDLTEELAQGAQAIAAELAKDNN